MLKGTQPPSPFSLPSQNITYNTALRYACRNEVNLQRVAQQTKWILQHFPSWTTPQVDHIQWVTVDSLSGFATDSHKSEQDRFKKTQKAFTVIINQHNFIEEILKSQNKIIHCSSQKTFIPPMED